MQQIINTYRQFVPAMRFAGIKYHDEDRFDGTFAFKWQEWFKMERFSELESLLTSGFKRSYEDHDASIGLMRQKEGEPFEYWIGMFLPEDSAVPDGFDFIDFPASHLGVCWVHGTEDDVYCKEDKCAQKLEAGGFRIMNDEKGARWFFERYVCPRFTSPDESGKVVLDICYFVREE